MKDTDNHAQTVERAIQSIAHHEDDMAVATARKLIGGEVERIEQSQAAFRQQVASGTCEVRITMGCVFVSQREAGGKEPAPVAHGRVAAPQRTPIAWGGGTCWYGRRCWICIDWECRA